MENLKENCLLLPKMTWEIGEIFTTALKSLKIGIFAGSFIQSYEFKIYREIFCHDMQNWKGNLLFVSKLTWRLWWILAQALENLKNSHNNGQSFTKVYNVWVKKVQRSYVWWQWILIQNLKKNWLLLSKLTWGIWETFTRTLESLKIGNLIGFFYPK